MTKTERVFREFNEKIVVNEAKYKMTPIMKKIRNNSWSGRAKDIFQ